jgi:hypothetical protein
VPLLSCKRVVCRAATAGLQAAAAAAKSTGKRGRKRKGTAGQEPRAKVARQGEVYIEGQVASAWRAPEASMLHNRSV